MTLPHPSDVVAVVTDGKGKWLGTAFFVGPTTALSCAHVVGNRSRSDLQLVPVGGARSLAVTDLVVRETKDLARLELSGSVLSWLPLHRDWVAGEAVVSHGFSFKYPQSRFPSGHPMDATTISGETEVDWKGVRSLVLRLAPSNADAGFSGGPLIAESGAALGVIRFKASADGGTYAIPAGTALDLWPDLAEYGVRAGGASEAPSPLVGSWLAFDPSKLQCLVVDSEACRLESLDKLSDMVAEVVVDDVFDGIWNAFRTYWKDRRLLKERRPRAIPQQATAADVRVARLTVTDAYTTRARLAEAVRLAVEADVAVLDVTGFEPGVMMLLGVRAATRRGVTIATHGTWQEARPLTRPFNLSDLAFTSHRRVGDPGTDPAMLRLGHRIAAGFTQMANLPRYQDLPGYEGIRYLGPYQEAWSTIPLEELVLVLCSYDSAFSPTWGMLQREVRKALHELQNRTRDVARLVDLRRPQLVSQALYELIRRCSACVTDWTGWSPSTFFEFGARLAISPWGSVQIVDDQWWAERDDMGQLSHDQYKGMREIFEPLGYLGKEDHGIGDRIARELISIKQTAGIEGGHFIRSVVIDSLSRVQEARAEVFHWLADEADSLHHHAQSQKNSSQALFPENTDAKAEQEDAALQRRIAAWLYLEYRVGADELPEGDPRKELWRGLGDLVVGSLYESGIESDHALAETIERRVDPEHISARLGKKGDSLRDRGDSQGAFAAYEEALHALDAALVTHSGELPTVLGELAHEDLPADAAAKVAELLGVRGGLLRRLDQTSSALDSYQAGADLERKYELATTYNRANTVKVGLVLGAFTLADVHPQLAELRSVLEQRLQADEQAADDAWLWADLADCRLLLGDRDEAAEAYKVFSQKAETRSPAKTLAVLREVAAALAEHGDAQAPVVAEALAQVELALGSSTG